MTAETPLEARAQGKRYRGRWAVRECTFAVPRGRIAALVGPNGSGKSTLLRMAAGLTRPSAGEVTVFGEPAGGQDPATLGRVGYVDQERPLYRSFRVAEMLRVGRELNPRWDQAAAEAYLGELAIPLPSRVGNLSIGQQAQVALTLCVAKRPDLLLLDEPVAALDPLARAQLMAVLLGSVADRGTTVVLSSHSLSDLETTCDFLVILSSARILLSGELDDLRGAHRLLIGRRDAPPPDLAPGSLVSASDASRQRTSLVCLEGDAFEAPAGWEVVEPTLEEIVLAYLKQAPPPESSPALQSVGAPQAPGGVEGAGLR